MVFDRPFSCATNIRKLCKFESKYYSVDRSYQKGQFSIRAFFLQSKRCRGVALSRNSPRPPPASPENFSRYVQPATLKQCDQEEVAKAVGKNTPNASLKMALLPVFVASIQDTSATLSLGYVSRRSSMLMLHPKVRVLEWS